MLLVSSGVSMFVPFGIGKLIDMINTQLKSSSPGEKDEMQNQLRNFCGTLIIIFIIGGVCNAARVFLMSVAGKM